MISCIDPEIVVGLLSLAGTLLGSVLGVLTANRLIKYRLSRLEEKAESVGGLTERLTAAEQSVRSAHHRLDEMNERIDKLESRYYRKNDHIIDRAGKSGIGYIRR